jgi:beta-galactosidase
MAHILPHWNWAERIGQITPVHVYTSGDEAELFLNGKSLGRKTKTPGKDFRLVWDDVKYTPGELKVVCYKKGKVWATDVVKTTGEASKMTLSANHTVIKAGGEDLSYITVKIIDKEGLMVPRTHNSIKFSVQGPGEIVATDNGDATSFAPFQSHERPAYNGMALVIVKGKKGQKGKFSVKAESLGLGSTVISLESK